MKTSEQLFNELENLFTEYFETSDLEGENNIRARIKLILEIFKADAKQEEINSLKEISMLHKIESK